MNLPRDKKIIMITKSDLESSDSFLAQGGICMLHDEDDYDSYFEDTMKAGHYENRKESVDIMIRSSREIIQDLIGYGVEFQKEFRKVILLKKEIRKKEESRKQISRWKKSMHLQEKGPIPDRESFSMRMLQEKKLQVSCLHR